MLEFINTTTLTTAKPHNIYKYAGLDSNNVRKCTAQMWFLLGVYHTNELLYKMGKSKISNCPRCQCGDSITHMILHCQEFSQIRQTFISDLSEQNASIAKYLDNDKISIVTFLDPESPSLPCEISEGWRDISKVYQLCRDFCWNIHAKKEKIKTIENNRKSIEQSKK